MKFHEGYGLAICAILSLGSSAMAQNRKIYDGGRFSVQYPSGWSVRELDKTSIVLSDIPNDIPIYQIMIAEVAGPIDKERALQIINANLSALATDNHCVLTYKESGPAKGNRIEVISNVRSPSQNADLVSSIGLTDHVYIEIMYEPDKRDVALAHATSVIQTIRLKSGTPQTPQQAPLASQSAAWKSYENADFSISYPAIWRVSTENRKFSATDPSDERRSVSIEWRPGVENKSGILNQCASIDELLTWFYKTNYEQLDSGRRQYPFTSVTHDDFQPGRLGGRSTNVSIVYQAAYQLPVTRLVNVQVVPRAGGAYIVTDSHPSEPNHEPFRLSVFNSIVFKAGALDGKAYCNYLGQ